MFILGFFWKKTTSGAALFATIGGFLFSIVLKFLPGIMDLSFLAPYGFAVKPEGSSIYEIPFLDRMGFVFVFCIVGMVLISLIQGKGQASPKGLEIDSSMFRPNRSFAIGSAIVLAIITTLYVTFW